MAFVYRGTRPIGRQLLTIHFHKINLSDLTILMFSYNDRYIK